MSLAFAVRNHCRKLARFGFFFCRPFNSSKCKTWAKMTTARIKLLRNKRETAVHQMRRDIALLLQSGQDATARIRVEHVIREQKMMAANEIIELFCERIVTRLSIIAKRKECPADLKEAISSLIFAGPRCSDIPELLAIRDIFLKKYGKDFVSAATDLRPNSGVNRLLIEKLSALNPSGELKLKVMKEIAKEYQVEWDTTDTETELLKPPEERIQGTRTFVSASSLPINRLSGGGGGGGGGGMSFQDAASAAKAAADSAKNAIAAAQAAAQLAQNSSNLSQSMQHNFMQSDSSRTNLNGTNDEGRELHGNYYRSDNISTANNITQNVKPHTDKFDDSDFDEESEMGQESPGSIYSPPFKDVTSNVATGGATASVHPKLPDYHALAARFESLKYRKS